MSDSRTNISIIPSKNAIKHGVYSSDVVLKWENQAEFEALHQALKEEYAPEGASEEEAIFGLASLHWKKRRLNIGSQLAFHRQAGAAEMADASKQGWEGVAEYLAKGDDGGAAEAIRAMAKSQAEAAKHICGTIFKHLQRATSANGLTAEPEGNNEFERLTTLAKETNIIGKELVLPMIKAVENNDLVQGVAERAYRPDITEKELKLHAEIDRQIEKAIRRLVMIKEYKNLYCRKAINTK